MATETKTASLPVRKWGLKISRIAIAILAFKVVVTGVFVYFLITGYQNGGVSLDRTFFLFILVGFVAQIIDGALGMAYGVSCTSLLLTFGIPAKVASASVHTSEIFTTGVSGLSHIRFKNIDKRLFLKIVLTGVLGACLGAYLLSDVFDDGAVRPYISIYLLGLGIYILTKAFKKRKEERPKTRFASVLAFFGGLFDAIGGGGWGPIVTSNLLGQGNNPRYTIGTVNTAEFFVTFFATVVFVFVLGIQHLDIVLGLIIGGVIAAPFGAYIASRIKAKILLILVSALVIVTSSWGIFQAFFS